MDQPIDLDKEYEIHHSRVKTFIQFIVFYLLLILCGYLALYSGKNASFLLYYLRAFVAALGVLVSGWGAVLTVGMLFKKTPALVINKLGVALSFKKSTTQFIPWADIENIIPYGSAGIKGIKIKVIDPQKYRKKGHIFYRLWNMANSMMTGGSSFTFSPLTLKISRKDLLELILVFYLYNKVK